MDNFKVIYRILKHLEAMMDASEPDMSPITAESLGISQMRWIRLIEMLINEGYIEGAELAYCLRSSLPIVCEREMRISLQGLEYLQENNLMKKVASDLKDNTEILAQHRR